jgi:molybdopterin synthase sulfur carrier subunit
MNIELRFFAGIREALGSAQESLVVPEQVKTVGEVRRLLRERGGVWAETLAEGRAVRMACNHQMCGADTVVSEGCEVAFFPPVTGG